MSTYRAITAEQLRTMTLLEVACHLGCPKVLSDAQDQIDQGVPLARYAVASADVTVRVRAPLPNVMPNIEVGSEY
jgi:hypothetical protein